MKTFSILICLIIPIKLFSQDPFELYIEKETDWYPSIFELYIKQYSDLDINRYLIDGQNITTIQYALEDFKHIKTEDVTEALDAVQSGKKVFFFIESFVWGGLEQGSVFSGSWQMFMPLCSGFYIYKKKCFQKEGLNYHCGKKENAYTVTFYIMQE